MGGAIAGGMPMPGGGMAPGGTIPGGRIIMGGMPGGPCRLFVGSSLWVRYAA